MHMWELLIVQILPRDADVSGHIILNFKNTFLKFWKLFFKIKKFIKKFRLYNFLKYEKNGKLNNFYENFNFKKIISFFSKSYFHIL